MKTRTKSPKQKLQQVKKIMKALLKRGQNCEAINNILRELIKTED